MQANQKKYKSFLLSLSLSQHIRTSSNSAFNVCRFLLIFRCSTHIICCEIGHFVCFLQMPFDNEADSDIGSSISTISAGMLSPASAIYNSQEQSNIASLVRTLNSIVVRTLFHIIMHFNASATDNFRKHYCKRRNC